MADNQPLDGADMQDESVDQMKNVTEDNLLPAAPHDENHHLTGDDAVQAHEAKEELILDDEIAKENNEDNA